MAFVVRLTSHLTPNHDVLGNISSNNINNFIISQTDKEKNTSFSAIFNILV